MRCWLVASGSGSGRVVGGPCCSVPVLLASVCVLFLKPIVCILATNEIGNEEDQACAAELLLVEQTGIAWVVEEVEISQRISQKLN